MSNDKAGGLFVNPLPIVMVALLAAGVLVENVPLDSARLVDSERMKSALMSHQDVEARLWQDPLAAIEKKISTRPDATQLSTSKTPAFESRPSMYLRNVITEELNKDHTVTVLAVSVFGGSFDAGAEWRRRIRFAILSALGTQGYSPENPNGLGYYTTILNNSDKALNDVQLTVPFEWFEKSMTAKVVVLWLDEDKLLSPYKNLISLFNELVPGPTHAKRASPALNFKLVGPAGSGTLVRLIGDTLLRKTDQKPGRKILDRGTTLDIFSPTATISNCDLYSLGYALSEGVPRQNMQWNCFMMKAPIELKNISELSIVRTTLTDDVLSAVLIWELWQRGINRSHSWPVQEESPQNKTRSTADPLHACKDGIVLIHEWDTEYARTLSRSITEGVKEFCEAGSGTEPPVRPFTYQRGIDGVLPGMDKSEMPIRDRTQQKENGKSNDLRKQLEDAPPEHAAGRNQYDYLRRLVFEIEQLDQDENFAKNGVRAIGILGSDVYDKLLILMALRNHFQNKIFFTTDLDARYLHADQKEWARNLVVASNFGLALDPKLQKSNPSFRDTYQTAVYLAALMALEDEAIIRDEVITEWTDTMKRLLRPRTFEIGRTEAVHLASPSVDDLKDWINGRNPEGTLGTNGDYLSCSIENWKDCSGVQPQWPMHLALKQPGTVFIIIIFGIGLVVLASRNVQQMLRTALDAHSRERSAVRITLAGIIVAFLVISLSLELIRRSINDSLKLGVGEPFLWLEGVSVWPSLTLRFISLILMIVLILVFTFRLKGEANSISNDFGFKLPGSWVLARSRWLAAFAGPNFDLWAYDKDGKRLRIPKNGKKTEIATLWQNYLRATSWREKMGWIVLSTVIVFLFMKMLFVMFAPPAFPHRGQLIQDLSFYLIRLNVVILWGVIFWTSYEARACAQFIQAVNRMAGHHTWSTPPVNSREAEFAVRTEDLAGYFDFRLITRATQRIQWLIYLPFVSILFMVLARSDLFDAMDFPLPLIAVVVLSLCYAIYSEMLLRKCAINAQNKALKEYEDRLFALKGQDRPAPAGTAHASSGTVDVIADANSAQGNSALPPITAGQITLLMERIRNTREGALAPPYQQPALQAVLLPFGGYGGVQLIEYLMSLTLSA